MAVIALSRLHPGERIVLSYENGFSELATFKKVERDWGIFEVDGVKKYFTQGELNAGWVAISRERVK